MDWIKVLNRHILLEYDDLSPTEFQAWIKIMALAAYLEHEPTRDQMLKHTHHKTLTSLQEKFKTHSTTLQDILKKVLTDVQGVRKLRESWKNKQQRYRDVNKDVSGDVSGDVSDKEKRREDKIKKEKKEKKEKIGFVLPDWIPQETWDAYLLVRDKKRAARTPYAYNLVIKELLKIQKEHRQDPLTVLNKSITNGWTDVYPMKENTFSGNTPSKSATQNDPNTKCPNCKKVVLKTDIINGKCFSCDPGEKSHAGIGDLFKSATAQH